VSAHAEFLRAATTDAVLATQIKSDFRSAKLSGHDFRMLEFVEKLSLCPWMVVANDIQGLRDVGFNDLEILHVVLGCSHFNYLNRIADGVGIQFEYHTDLPDFEKPDSDSPQKEPSTRGVFSASFLPPSGPWLTTREIGTYPLALTNQGFLPDHGANPMRSPGKSMKLTN
jgi:hypothetical protein